MNPDWQEHLNKVFGLPSFRSLQETVVSRLMEKKYVAAFLPTGMGKTLLYQFPTSFYKMRTVVISPLIALIADQVNRCKRLGIPVEALHGLQSQEENRKSWERYLQADYGVLLISPERWIGGLGEQIIRRFPAVLMVIDEVHCMATWGLSFRESYLKLTYPFKNYPDSRLLALSATPATGLTEMIRSSFNLPYLDVLTGDMCRVNLGYQVRIVPSKLDLLIKTLNVHKEPAIIYTQSRNRTEQLAGILQKHSIKAGAYHAGLETSARQKQGARFMSGELPVMVSTSAFGMGVDKSDIRFIFHLEMPNLIEDYLQESGRAGRDGKMAWAGLILEQSDLLQQKALIRDLESLLTAVESGNINQLLRTKSFSRLLQKNPFADIKNDQILSEIKISIPENLFYRPVTDPEAIFLADRLLHYFGGRITREVVRLAATDCQRITGFGLEEAIQVLNRINDYGIEILFPDDAKKGNFVIPDDKEKKIAFLNWLKLESGKIKKRAEFWSDFVNLNGCRMAFLVQSLSDPLPGYRCGHCDWCRTHPDELFTISDFDRLIDFINKEKRTSCSSVFSHFNTLWSAGKEIPMLAPVVVLRMIEFGLSQQVLKEERTPHGQYLSVVK